MTTQTNPIITDVEKIERFVEAWRWAAATEAQADSHGNRWDQGVWAERLAATNWTEPALACQSGMCFAGQVVVNAGAKFLFEGNWQTSACLTKDGRRVDISSYAAQLLGILRPFGFGDNVPIFAAANDLEDLRYWTIWYTGVDPDPQSDPSVFPAQIPDWWLDMKQDDIDDALGLDREEEVS